ncbi:MAG: hypothetical protein JSS35_18975, partial [Proteobacteria bacterium]|nr:hypothetical protein [Pseudomonadota bacterium]
EPVNIVGLAAPEGPLIGKVLAPGVMDAFWQGNIYRHLCRPLNHHYLLDMRADGGALGRACSVTWNTPDSPFTPADAEILAAVQPFMERALAERPARVRWRSVTNGTAHMVLRAAGGELVSIGAEAERILMRSHLLGQDVSMTSAPRRAPGFAQVLASQIEGRDVAEMSQSVTDGRIHARASRTTLINRDGASEIGLFIALDLQVAEEVLAVDRLMALDLTPLQRRIALYAVQGGARDRCEAAFGVSAEALKKHLRGIYRQTGAANWAGLGDLAATLAP